MIRAGLPQHFGCEINPEGFTPRAGGKERKKTRAAAEVDHDARVGGTDPAEPFVDWGDPIQQEALGALNAVSQYRFYRSVVSRELKKQLAPLDRKLDALQAENEQLRAELEQCRAEQPAAH